MDIILTSLQDHTHVASLLGYSSPTDGPEVLPPGPAFTASPDPTYGTLADHPDTHLAEILMKTLLRNLGFYTVSRGVVFIDWDDCYDPFRAEINGGCSDRKSLVKQHTESLAFQSCRTIMSHAALILLAV